MSLQEDGMIRTIIATNNEKKRKGDSGKSSLIFTYQIEIPPLPLIN
jgi:hypothetical protein